MPTANETTTLHLWFNGYDHAPGATEADAQAWLMRETHCSADDCEGDGWQMVPDDERIRDEDGTPTDETAAQWARFIAEQAEKRAAGVSGGEGDAR